MQVGPDAYDAVLLFTVCLQASCPMQASPGSDLLHMLSLATLSLGVRAAVWHPAAA